MLDELLILKKIKGGDIKAFEELFRRYYFPLCCYAAGITGQMEVAEEIVEELYFYPPVRLYCGRLHDAGMLYAVFGRPLYCEQTDSGERRNPGKPDESRISSGVLRFSDWSKYHLQSDFPVQDPALRDFARKCRAGLLEERTSAEDDGGYPEKIKKWGRI